MGSDKTARALGWFSIGLGLAEAVATRRLGRTLGLESYGGLIRAFGAREIATGVGILATNDPTPGIWARVGGDALDLATLGVALRRTTGKRGRVVAALGTVAAITAVDLACARQLSKKGGEGDAPAAAQERSLSIGRSADDLYRLWREPGTLSTIMASIGEVIALDHERSRWTITGPLRRTMTWETEIVEERPGEMLRWRSVAGAQVGSEGLVRFRPAPGDWGTEVTLRLQIEPPRGPVGAIALRVARGGARLLLGQALHRFKSLAETGEVPTITGQPAARNDGRDR
ncbi:MAG TPA: SRPBCC family protein [Thermomicrobiales bacterium]|jgi:uncharacterized membrane protein